MIRYALEAKKERDVVMKLAIEAKEKNAALEKRPKAAQEIPREPLILKGDDDGLSGIASR